MGNVVTAKNVTIRLFKSDFLEFFTRVHWSVPLILYIPVISYCLFTGFRRVDFAPGFFALSVALGLVGWSLLEYLLHRFLFHYQPKSEKAKRAFYLIHEVHHEYPSDAWRLVMPPIESIPFAIVLYLIFSTAMPAKLFYPFFAGFGLGYLAYDMIHYATHHLPLKNRIGQFLKQQHLKHHFQHEASAFGVSSPLWDWVFRTQIERKT